MIAPQPEAPNVWTVKELLAWTEDYFRRAECASPRLDAELLLAAALGCTRMELYTGFQRPVEGKERAEFRASVARRGKREPVAYILGTKEFYSLAFEVTPAVLIPRPETEHLVDAALEALGRDVPDGGEDCVPAAPEARRVLDLGTGAGNIAIAIAKSCSYASVDAVDASADALAVAERNARAHDVASRVELFAGDLFAPLPIDRRYDVIVSNPPYVAESEYGDLMPEVRDHEPRAALVDEKSRERDGLGYYRAIASAARERLAPAGHLIVEVGDGQAGDVRETLLRAGLGALRVIKDYGGIERVVVGRG